MISSTPVSTSSIPRTAYSHWVPGNRGGESESILGRWFRHSGKRDRVTLATKVGKWAQRPGLAPANIRLAVEESLQRLQTDVIDLYQAHADDPAVPLADTLGAFARLIEQGKVRVIGASNYSADRLAEALDTSERLGLPRYESLQPQYNLCDRAGFETALEPLVRAREVGVIGYYSLASGFLSGKYRSAAGRRQERGARRRDRPLPQPARDADPAGAGRHRRHPSRNARAGGAGLVDGAPVGDRADRQCDQRGAAAGTAPGSAPVLVRA